jgi:hypothetical protein
MKSLIINIGRADISEIEKQVNAKLATVEKFSSIKLTFNGHNNIAVVLYDDAKSTITKPQVKLVQFSINDAVEAAKTIDAALEGLDVVSVEPTAIIDMDRLLVVYDAKGTSSDDTTGDQTKENDDQSTEDKG